MSDKRRQRLEARAQARSTPGASRPGSPLRTGFTPRASRAEVPQGTREEGPRSSRGAAQPGGQGVLRITPGSAALALDAGSGGEGEGPDGEAGAREHGRDVLEQLRSRLERDSQRETERTAEAAER